MCILQVLTVRKLKVNTIGLFYLYFSDAAAQQSKDPLFAPIWPANYTSFHHICQDESKFQNKWKVALALRVYPNSKCQTLPKAFTTRNIWCLVLSLNKNFMCLNSIGEQFQRRENVLLCLLVAVMSVLTNWRWKPHLTAVWSAYSSQGQE